MSTLRHHILAAFALLMMIMQGAAFAHAASYGGEDHSHDGVACDAGLVEDDIEAALPAPAVVTVAPIAWDTDFETVAIIRDIPASPARAPPPRAPPH